MSSSHSGKNGRHHIYTYYTSEYVAASVQYVTCTPQCTSTTLFERRWDNFQMPDQYAASSIHFAFEVKMPTSVRVWHFSWQNIPTSTHIPSFHFVIHKSATIVTSRTMKIQTISDRPAVATRPGRYQNYTNPADLRVEGYTAVVICLTTSVLAVAMPMWTKTRLIRKVFLEDCNFIPLPCEWSGTWWLTISGTCCLTLVRLFMTMLLHS